MEVVNQHGYTEELSTHGLKPEKYLLTVRKAMTLLHWYIAEATANSITCVTQNDYYSPGEAVRVTVKEKTAVFQSISRDYYNSEEEKNRQNAVLLKEIIPQAIEELEKEDRNLHPMHREKYGALIPSKSYLVTPVVIYINVLIYLAMIVAGISPLQPTARSLFEWGGNLRPAVLYGDWWRLISYMFLHAGGLHILMNTYALLYIGMFLEPLLGKLRFASAYLLTGICAGLLSMTMHANSVGVGASGAIFGMYGVFLSILTTGHIEKTMRKTMLRSILFFVVFNLLMGLQGNTDNAAHIGGLLSGLAIGYAYYPGISKRVSFRKQLFTVTITAIAVILLTAFTFTQL
ncbi:rhomboid family intramembrane serine protease [Chitinophagaceae bacterium MMS25-I14]